LSLESWLSNSVLPVLLRCPSLPPLMNRPSPLTRFFFWLSGAGEESLKDCPDWERRKYVAFGATVLVPSLFAFIASAYAVHTLTENWSYILPIAIAWSFIILTIDRALLATYRAYQSFFRKISQFGLRIVVATLMGLTISHPLALLLFRDTVSTVIEKHRESDIAEAHDESALLKARVEGKIALTDAEAGQLRERWNQTYSVADFLHGESIGTAALPTAEEAAARAELERVIAENTAPLREKIAGVEAQLESQDAASKTLQGELDFWQKEFERELNGQRSGLIGLGPRAKSIQTDQLMWRRDESKRLSGVVESLTLQRNLLQEELVALEQRLATEAAGVAAERNAKVKAEEARLAGLRQQVQQQQADTFVEQQNEIRATLKQQIEALGTQGEGLRAELAQLSLDEQTRVAALRVEPRRDLLTQTLALHELFENDQEGGKFALIAYLVLTLLFMLVDTIPLVVKFFSKPGPYDTLLDLDEVRFDKERQAYLKNSHRFVEELASSRLLHLARNKPLERALVEGVDRSRAAKEFIQALMELEHTFEERMQAERARLALEGSGAEHGVLVKEMADRFYSAMRERMEAYFDDRGTPLEAGRAQV